MIHLVACQELRQFLPRDTAIHSVEGAAVRQG